MLTYTKIKNQPEDEKQLIRRNDKDNDADKYKLLVLGFSPVVEKGLISEYCLFNACDWFVF